MLEMEIRRQEGSNKLRRQVKREKGLPLLEAVKWIYHNQQTIASSSTDQVVTFFGGSVSNDLVGNLKTQGQLAKPNEFFLHGISVHVPNNAAIADVENLYNSAVARLRISGKEYVNQKLHFVPSAGGLTGYGYGDGAASAVTKNMVTNCTPSANGYYNLAIGASPLHIVDQESFEAELQLFGASSFSANLNVIFALHGILARAVV